MNGPLDVSGRLIAAAATALLLAACSNTPVKPLGADLARTKLNQLQADPLLAGRAPVAISEAEAAVRAAEVPQTDNALGSHLVLIAERRVDTARAQAQSRLAEDQRKELAAQREGARLDARTREADAAHSDAASARDEADKARAAADISRSKMEAARLDAEATRMQNDDLQSRIAELDARATDRGLVVTLGDVLFQSGNAELKGGAIGHLDKLATFLGKYPERTVVIEGHTDSVGDPAYNVGLSQRRAASVKTYLVGQGVAANRLSVAGLGESVPVAGNDSASGRQQNRRVEVIIENMSTASR